MSIPGPIQTPREPLSALYLFQIFGTQDQYKAVTGNPAPAFDPTRPTKRWFDPAATPGDLRTYPTYRIGPSKADGTLTFSPDAIYLSGDDAARVNIPNDIDIARGGFGITAQMPIPMRLLAPGESLRNLPVVPGMPFTSIYVVNDALYAAQAQADQEASGKFLAEDRAMLRAIAAKVGAGL